MSTPWFSLPFPDTLMVAFLQILVEASSKKYSTMAHLIEAHRQKPFPEQSGSHASLRFM